MVVLSPSMARPTERKLGIGDAHTIGPRNRADEDHFVAMIRPCVIDLKLNRQRKKSIAHFI